MQPINFNLIREDILPQVQVISSYEMIAGEARRIAFQMLNKYSNQAQPIKTGWKVMIEFTGKVGSLYKEATVQSCNDNNSVFYTDLTPDDTKEIVNGKVIVWAISTLLADRAEIMETITGLPTSFVDGILALPDSVDLTDIHEGDYVEQTVGADRTTFLVLGINDVAGAKSVTLREDAAIDLAATEILISRSSRVFKAVKDRIISKGKARC